MLSFLWNGEKFTDKFYRKGYGRIFSMDLPLLPSIHQSLYPFLPASIAPSSIMAIHQFDCPFAHPLTNLLIHPSIPPSLHPSIHPSVRPSIQSTHPSIHSSIHPVILPSIREQSDLPSVADSPHYQEMNSSADPSFRQHF